MKKLILAVASAFAISAAFATAPKPEQAASAPKAAASAPAKKGVVEAKLKKAEAAVAPKKQ